MPTVRENALRIVFGFDIFISYSRADGATYATRLGSELTAVGFLCRLDQWGASPGTKVPSELLRDLRRSGMLVVVGSSASTRSTAVETEIREFLATKRFIVPVDLDGTIRSAGWWPLLDGLAVAEEARSDKSPPSAPSPGTVERIQNTATFVRRSVVLRWLMVTALVIFAILVGLAVAAGRRAAAERAGAKKATEERTAAEQKRDAVLKQLSTAEKVARSRELARQANEETENQARLQAAIHAGETQETDAAREALVNAIQKVMEGDPGSFFAVNTTGNLIALAGGHGQGVLMDLNSGTTTNLCGSPERIGFLSFSPNSRYLLTARHHHRYEVYANGETHELPADEYQLWDTAAGTPLGSVVLDGTPTKVSWSPDSSMFVAFENIPWSSDDRAYRMTIGPSGSLTAVEQPIFSGEGIHQYILFSGDRRLFVMHSALVGGVSLWDYHGKKLWSSEKETVNLMAFRNRSSRLVIGFRLSRPTTNTQDQRFEVVDLDPSGRPRGTSTPFSPEEFDYRILGSKGVTNPHDYSGDLGYDIDRSLRAKNPDLLGEHGCGYVIAKFDAGLVFCAVDKHAGYLFDVATQKSVGGLKQWMFKDMLPEAAAFALDGKTLVAAGLEQLAAWDTNTRNLLWNKSMGVSTLTVSADGKRILVSPWPTNQHRIAIDPQTGQTVGTTSDLGEIQWVNRSATRLMTSVFTSVVEGSYTTLVLLDFDHSVEPHRFELMTADKAELEQDRKALKENPSMAVLLDIARRRLRPCDSSPASRP